MLHIGSYDDEAPILADLHSNVIPQQQLEENGLHHEIYLGAPQKVAPERLKTILRQPVRRV
ncbi:GyrI-like domain-containing protein [Scrofimicrobium canadense]|uniref:GyrI-like domain-containing protein n=1 Tax=Scrofimicrobium canadense TaxID=2652290 RepID=UPI0019805B11|nr:GyrI-like domain-containing protein [Scrofimicrobium canadense]